MERSTISSNSPDLNYSSTNFGLRFRKKRTYSQMLKSSSMSEDNIANNLHNLKLEEEINKSSKKFKPIKEEIDIVISTEKNKENINKKKETLQKKKKEDRQTLITLEYNRISNQITALKSELKKEKIPKILGKIMDYLTKHKNKKINKDKIIKVTNYFKDVEIALNREYLEETRPINIYLALMDTLLGINHIYDKALNSDSLLGNFLFYYYGQLNLITISDYVLPLMKENCEVKSEAVVIPFKNLDNITNNNKSRLLGDFYGTLKNFKLHFETGSKFKFAESINNSRLQIYDTLTSTQKSKINFKEAQIIDYDKEKDIKYSITNNDFYLNSQLMKGDFIKKASGNILELQNFFFTKQFNIYKTREKGAKAKVKIAKYISDLEVFKIDSAKIIKDFLSVD